MHILAEERRKSQTGMDGGYCVEIEGYSVAYFDRNAAFKAPYR